MGFLSSNDYLGASLLGGYAVGSYFSGRKAARKQRRAMKAQRAEYALLQQEALAERQKAELEGIIDKQRIGEKLRRSSRRAGSGFLGSDALTPSTTLG